MLKDIIGIIGTRYFVALLNLLLIFVNSKVLGLNGMGLIGVLYASANIAVVFNSILCGNTIVYFMNRYRLRFVFYPAYIWSFIGASIACGAMFALGMLPAGYEFTVFALAILMSLVSANSQVLLGKDMMRGFNLVFMLLGVLTFVLLMGIYYLAGVRTVEGYLAGVFIAYIAAYVCSFILLLPHLMKREADVSGVSFVAVLREMFVYGVWSGADNMAEGLTTRLNYFFVQSAGGYGNTGLFDAGTKVSESVWHVSNSISHVEHKSISKTTDREQQKLITLRLFKLTYCVLIAVMAVIVCVPEWVYTEYLFTAEFAGMRRVITGMSVGIVALGSNRILSHHFIGSGSIRYSTFSSVFGLVVLLVAGVFIIPVHGVFGAAVVSSIAYTAMLVYSVIAFMKQTSASLRELFPSKKDVAELRRIILSAVR